MSSIKRLTAALGALSLCAVLSSTAAAQVTGDILATASVDGRQAITVNGAQNLEFGTLNALACTGGCPNATDGRYEAAGLASEQVTFRFSLLPSLLSPVTAPAWAPGSCAAGSSFDATGDAGLAISFGAADGKLLTPGTGALISTFDPTVTQGAGGGLTFDAAGDLWVGIAGTATTRADQTTGCYEGTITLEVQYYN